MVGVATVALLERKPTISRDLFTRYWRDVHGVMAARIPGFHSYTQYHVTPTRADIEPIEGIAVVTFANEADREGLVRGAVVPHIHRDEQNLFRRALLYNLEAGAVREIARTATPDDGWFIVIAQACPDQNDLLDQIAVAGLDRLVIYDLLSGDPAGWNGTDVSDGGAGRQFSTLVHGMGDRQSITATVDRHRDDVALYTVDDAYELVAAGRPTPMGLRGKSAVDTIREAGATNQLCREVECAVYRLDKN